MKFLTLFFICYVNVALGNTFYVSNAGSDLNSGLSVQAAFKTIQQASDVVSAGDSVIILAGSYAGFDHRSSSGTASEPIVFTTIDSVLITSSGPIRNDGINIEGPDYIVIEGFIVNNMPGNGNGIRVVNSDHIIIRNNRCDGNAERGIFTGFTDDILIEYNVCTNSIDEHGIYVSNSSDRPVIRFNECYGNNNIGIHMNGDLSAGGDGIISDAEVYGNVIHDNNLAAGINMDGCESPRVYNNVIYNNHNAQGIALFQIDGAIATRNAEIFNNTIIVPFDGRWGVLVNTGSHIGTKIYNNIIINDHSFRGSVTTESLQDGFMCDHNIVNNKMSATGDGSSITLAQWQALGQGQNTLLADSKLEIFKEPISLTPNYDLAVNSQAIDSGTSSIPNLPIVDIKGLSRPQNDAYDIGAYEKIYCPKIRVLSALSSGFMYFAQDSIIIEEALNVNVNAELFAPIVDNRDSLHVTLGSTLKIISMGCNPNE